MIINVHNYPYVFVCVRVYVCVHVYVCVRVYVYVSACVVYACVYMQHSIYDIVCMLYP